MSDGSDEDDLAPTAPRWTMEELLARVEAALPRLVQGSQPRYKVTDLPDARTVRYYVSLGVVDRPAGKRGTAALYSTKHLLQVLAIKKLQSAYLPLRKIQEVLAGKDVAALQGLLGADVVLEDLVREDPSVGAVVAADRAGERWMRILLFPGLEIHWKEGFDPTSAERDAILSRVADLLGGSQT